MIMNVLYFIGNAIAGLIAFVIVVAFCFFFGISVCALLDAVFQ